MTSARGRGPLPQPIEVQGLPVRPGDQVLLVIDGQTIERVFEGVDPETGDALLLVEDKWTSDPRQEAGPFPVTCLRHPNFLSGFIREIDAAE